MNNNNLTPIETAMNIFDPNILWFDIPGYRGYEVSTFGHIRSMKHFKKYPYGLLIKPCSDSNPSDPVYELSNDNNKRVRIHYSEIAKLANSSGHVPRGTMATDTMSRNKFVKNDEGAYVKVYNGRKRTKRRGRKADDTVTSYAKFTIIKEGDNN